MRIKRICKRIIAVLLSVILVLPFYTITARAEIVYITIEEGGTFVGTNSQSGAINQFITTITLDSDTRIHMILTDYKGRVDSCYYASSKKVAEEGDNITNHFLFTVTEDGGKLEIEVLKGSARLRWLEWEGMDYELNQGTPEQYEYVDNEDEEDEDNKELVQAIADELNINGLFEKGNVIIYLNENVPEFKVVGSEEQPLGFKLLNKLFKNKLGFSDLKVPVKVTLDVEKDGTRIIKMVASTGFIEDDKEKKVDVKNAYKKLSGSDVEWNNFKDMIDNYSSIADAINAFKDLRKVATGKKKAKIPELPIELSFGGLVSGGKSLGSVLAEGLEPDFEVVGYIEIRIDKKNEVMTCDSNIVVKATADQKPYVRQNLTLLAGVPIPWYWTLALSYEGVGSLGFNITQYHGKETSKSTGQLGGKGSVSGVLGLGLYGIANMQGEADLSLDAEMLPKGYLGGNIKLKMSTRFLNYYKESPYSVDKEFVLFGSPSLNTVSGSAIELDSLSEASNWVAASADAGAYEVSGRGLTADVLSTGIMEGAEPHIVHAGEYDVMIYNTMSEGADSGRIMYSVRKDDNWSEPICLWDNGLSDYNYDMEVIGDKLYIVWQKSGDTIEESDGTEQMLDALRKSEICAAEFDGASGTFVNQRYLTDNSYVDMLPELVHTSDGSVRYAWISNTANDISGISVKNQLNVCSASGDTSKAADLTGYIGNYEVYYDGSYNTVYSCNEISQNAAEGDVCTTTLRRIGSSEQLIEEESEYILGLKACENEVYYNRDGSVYSYNVSTGEKKLLGDENMPVDFEVCSNDGKKSLVWIVSEPEDGYSAYSAKITDSGLASTAYLFTRESGRGYGFDCILNDEGKYNFVFDEKNTKDGSHILSEVVKEETADVIIDALDMTDLSREGGYQNMTLRVVNEGEKKADKLHVRVSCGGINYLDKTYSKSLAPGESKLINESFYVTKITQPKEFTVSVYPEGDADALDTVSTELGQCDLEIVEDERRFNEDGSCDIICKVTNLTDTLSGGKVCIYNDPSRQTVIGEEKFGKLGKNESDYITFHVAKKDLAFTESGLTAIQAAVIPVVTDYKASNDISTFIIGADSFIGGEEKPEESKSIESCEALLDKKTYAYSGSTIIPKVTVKDGDTVLTKGTDYTVEYKDNTDKGTGSVVITGIGDYSGMLTETFKIVKPSFRYRAYVQKKSWVAWQTAEISATKASGMAGTTDDLRMETIQMQLSGIGGEVKYRAYVQKKGWTQWATTADKSTYAGTKGLSLRTELIQLKTSGKIDDLYDIYYRAYCQKLGWLGWASNNQKAGTQGYAYMLEAFQVNLVPKGEKFKPENKSTRKTFYDRTKDGANPK